MKTLAFILLSQLSTRVALAADIPTFTQSDPKDYIGTDGNDIELGPTDIDVQTEGDFVVTLGAEKTSQVAAVLGANCKDPRSEICQNSVKSALGVGPGNDGLHKRVVGVVIGGIITAWLAYSIATVVSYFGNDDYSEYFQGQAQIKIPKKQKEEIEKWNADGDEFNFKPHKGDPITVTLDSPTTEIPANVATITKEENGDLTLTFPGHGQDLKDALEKVLCKKEDSRSLSKRITMSCLVARSRALLEQFQVGGALDGVYYLDPMKEFPKPKTDLLVETITNGEDYIVEENLWFGAEETQQMKKNYATLSGYTSVGYSIGRIPVEGDKFKIPKWFLDNQMEDKGDEEKTCTEYPTFCSNCGGNAIDDDMDTQIGSCKGVRNGALKGCECFIDLPKIGRDWKLSDAEDAYERILEITKEKYENPDKKDRLPTKCKPKTLPEAWGGDCTDELCQNTRPLSDKAPYKAAVREFCNGGYKFTADPGYKDPAKWSATVDIFTDSVQKDPDTGLPPICAVYSQNWDETKYPDSKKRCLNKEGEHEGNSQFRIGVLPKEDQKGCKQLSEYKLPTGDECEEKFNAVIDDCIQGEKDDETGGYHPEKRDNGCWEWWIYSKHGISGGVM